jgi:hypothetical protein
MVEQAAVNRQVTRSNRVSGASSILPVSCGSKFESPFKAPMPKPTLSSQEAAVVRRGDNSLLQNRALGHIWGSCDGDLGDRVTVGLSKGVMACQRAKAAGQVQPNTTLSFSL